MLQVVAALLALSATAGSALYGTFIAYGIAEERRLDYPPGAVLLREERWDQNEMPWDGWYSVEVRMTEAQFHRWAREHQLLQAPGEPTTYAAPGGNLVEYERATYEDGVMHYATAW